MILVEVKRIAIQWIGQETLPGTMYKDKNNRSHYFYTYICNSIRFDVMVIITVTIIADDDVVVVVPAAAVVVLVFHLDI